MATVAARRKSESAPGRPETLADLLRRLGNIPARRVRLQPAPGTATERDVLINNESTLKTAISELVDKSNTKAEIVRKIDEYFSAGTRLVWVVDPKTRTVRVHTAPRGPLMLGVGDVFDGGDVLPRLRIPVRDLFELGE
jgi:hypothetical protein